MMHILNIIRCLKLADTAGKVGRTYLKKPTSEKRSKLDMSSSESSSQSFQLLKSTLSQLSYGSTKTSPSHD